MWHAGGATGGPARARGSHAGRAPVTSTAITTCTSGRANKADDERCVIRPQCRCMPGGAAPRTPLCDCQGRVAWGLPWSCNAGRVTRGGNGPSHHGSLHGNAKGVAKWPRLETAGASGSRTPQCWWLKTELSHGTCHTGEQGEGAGQNRPAAKLRPKHITHATEGWSIGPQQRRLIGPWLHNGEQRPPTKCLQLGPS